MRSIKIIILLLCYSVLGLAQNDIDNLSSQANYKIIFPSEESWNILKEGQGTSFDLEIENNTDNRPFNFVISQGKQIGMQLDSSGHFEWKPAFNLVDRIEKKKLYQVLIEAKSNSGDFITRTMDLELSHTNRTPQVNELRPFYIEFNKENKYQIENTSVYDEDEDPLVFIPSVEELPQGMHISSRGEVVWKPSYTQFQALQVTPMFVSFWVEDQPGKARTKGRIKLLPTQLDLPPRITVLPNTKKIVLAENETVNIGFYLSDPNGDSDIQTFDFLTNNSKITKDLLVKNTANQYEFIWTPDYQFVKDPADSLNFHIDFFVLDKTKQRAVKRVYFNVTNAINEIEIDNKNFDLYKGSMARGWELLEQLKEKEEELKKTYDKAKKGKRQRSVVNAGLGATTGLSSIFTKDNESLQRTISTVGGTTVLTIGTLEATEVIGKSMKDLLERLNYVIEKKNEIQTKGDIFARDYALKSARRSPSFNKAMDSFLVTMNLKGIVALELDASWESKKTATDKNIRKTFKDYSQNR